MSGYHNAFQLKLALMFWAAAPCFGADVVIHGLISDSNGGRVARAAVSIETLRGSPAAFAKSDIEGAYRMPAVGPGRYLLRAAAAGFEDFVAPLHVVGDSRQRTDIVLSVANVRTSVTVTSNRGSVEEAGTSPYLVTVKSAAEIRRSPSPTIGNALEGSLGVLAQQTTYGQTSPTLRGLTGYHVLNLVDGVRLNNSTFRSGPNQYLAFVQPSQVGALEAVLGPAGSRYGSDSIGGTIHVLTPQLRLEGNRGRPAVHGRFSLAGASTDASGRSSGRISLDGARWGLMLGGGGHRLNDLRPGGGTDSRSVFIRHFGLPSRQVRDLIGDRQQDTGFTQYGYDAKLFLRPADDHLITLWHQRGEQDGVRQYRNLLGGRARLQSSFDPQRLNLSYLRYEKLNLGALSSLSATVSVNSQRDSSTSQNERLTDRIRRDENGVDSYGYAFQGTIPHTGRGIFVFGAEGYRESIASRRFETDPVSGDVAQVRGLFPNGSRYTTVAAFAEETREWLDGRLRTVFGLRYTNVNARTFASRDRFGVIDTSERFHDISFNSAATVRLSRAVALNFLVGKGFRAPNMNDLGAVGLNSLGFETPASEIARAGGLVGSDAGENAVSLGRRVSSLAPETLWNYEAGVAIRKGKLSLRSQLFDAEMFDPIVRRTVLFPLDAPPERLGGQPVQIAAPTPEQAAQGVAPAVTPLDALSVKAFVNEGRIRYYGFEQRAELALSQRWMITARYSFLAGRELNPNRNVRRLPPQRGSLSLSRAPGGDGFWWRLTWRGAGAQNRLSGGDLTDDRIGAARSRNDIRRVFSAAVISPWVDPGADARANTDDDVFVPTGETRLALLDRVLPIGGVANDVLISTDTVRALLHLKTAGWATLDFMGGFTAGEDFDVTFGVENLLDKNYRSHGSGFDAPGFNGFAGISYRF